jgi:thiol-disulfide isomerase/thioredoxin
MQGNWSGYLMLNEADPLHVDFKFNCIENKCLVVMVLGKDTAVIREVILTKDSLIFELPLFDSKFKLSIKNSKTLEGAWCNYNKGNDYQIPFFATFKQEEKVAQLLVSEQIYKRYKVVFNPNTQDSYEAIGLFKQDGFKIEGTFATETGDYRFLKGNVNNNSLVLDCFDGAHAFLFKALIKNDSIINGVFLSGTHSKESWIASIDNNFELSNADSITKEKIKGDYIHFKLPNANRDSLTWEQLGVENKVVIVQIMGSWCPNCYDETFLLAEYYKKYKNEGLEIIPVAFEATTDLSVAVKRLDKMYKNIGVDFNYLIGGINDKKTANSIFPELSEIKSFPTTIFIDRKRKIRKIHSGFYGPETGRYYDKYRVETDKYIVSLLSEN